MSVLSVSRRGNLCIIQSLCIILKAHNEPFSVISISLEEKTIKKLVFLRDHTDAVADAVLHSPSSYSIVFVIPVFVTGLLKNCISYNCTLPIGFP